MRLVILETPFAGRGSSPKADREGNITFAQDCMRDCLLRGEAPFASHMLYPGALDDNEPAERALGIEAGLTWGTKAEASIVYTDRGMSKGMRLGIARAKQEGRPIEFRTLGSLANKDEACTKCVSDAFFMCEDCCEIAGELLPACRERFYKQMREDFK